MGTGFDHTRSIDLHPLGCTWRQAMKYDGLFLIGDVNIFDYQKSTGFKRWNTLVAAYGKM